MSTPYLDEQRLQLSRERHPDYPVGAAAVVRLTKVIARRINDHANAMLTPAGLTHPEFNVLMMLFGTPDYTLNPSLLSDAAGEKSANITRLTDQLCAKGYVRRTVDQADRRKIAVTLTPAGRKALQDLLPAVSQGLMALTAGLSPRELEQLERLQRKLLTHLDAGP